MFLCRCDSIHNSCTIFCWYLGMGYGNQKKKKNEIKLLLLCNLVVINHFYKCLYYLYYALNPGFRPTIIHWFCGNGHKNQRKNKWGIALSNWWLVPLIYHHEQDSFTIVSTIFLFRNWHFNEELWLWYQHSHSNVLEVDTKDIFVSGFRMKLMCTLKKMLDLFLDTVLLIISDVTSRRLKMNSCSIIFQVLHRV